MIKIKKNLKEIQKKKRPKIDTNNKKWCEDLNAQLLKLYNNTQGSKVKIYHLLFGWLDVEETIILYQLLRITKIY